MHKLFGNWHGAPVHNTTHEIAQILVNFGYKLRACENKVNENNSWKSAIDSTDAMKLLVKAGIGKNGLITTQMVISREEALKQDRTKVFQNTHQIF